LRRTAIKTESKKKSAAKLECVKKMRHHSMACEAAEEQPERKNWNGAISRSDQDLCGTIDARGR
jgi:hypothetical protein